MCLELLDLRLRWFIGAEDLAIEDDAEEALLAEEGEELGAFRDTGLERTQALEQDISFMVSEFGLERPAVGPPGRDYAEALRNVDSIPEFMCHYYNHYFAHTAGGRMIGKQMSSLLLNKKTLEFYKVRLDMSSAVVALIWSLCSCFWINETVFKQIARFNFIFSGMEISTKSKPLSKTTLKRQQPCGMTSKRWNA